MTFCNARKLTKNANDSEVDTSLLLFNPFATERVIMSVNVSLKPVCFTSEGHEGLKVWHKPATNLAHFEWIKHVRSLRMDILPEPTDEAPRTNKDIQEFYVKLETLAMGPIGVALAKSCITDIEGFEVDGAPCKDVQTFFSYFPDPTVVTALVFEIGNRSRLSEDEEKNSVELQTSQLQNLEESLIPTAPLAQKQEDIN